MFFFRLKNSDSRFGGQRKNNFRIFTMLRPATSGNRTLFFCLLHKDIPVGQPPVEFNNSVAGKHFYRLVYDYESE